MVWTWDSTLLGLIGAVFGVAGVLLIGAVVASIPMIGHGLAFLGRYSMATYLGHITVMAALRVVLLRAGVESVFLHAFLGTAVGTGASLLIVWASSAARR